MTRTTAPAASNSTHTVFCRIYGVLAVLVGLLTLLIGGMASAARSSGNTLGGIIEKPGEVSAIAGPYTLAFGFIAISLGIAIFRRNVGAAIALLLLGVANDALSYLIPALNIDNKPEFGGIDLVANLIVLALTAAVYFTVHPRR